MDLLSAIDFDVLILLASIMVVNHVVVHLRETRKVVSDLQQLARDSPRKGFWIISLVAFAASPFLTNDGVCLLFVEPILQIFDHDDQPNKSNDEFAATASEFLHGYYQERIHLPLPGVAPEGQSEQLLDHQLTTTRECDSTQRAAEKLKLTKGDALFFLLALACSSNIGSALTYTGNPQNMVGLHYFSDHS